MSAIAIASAPESIHNVSADDTFAVVSQIANRTSQAIAAAAIANARAATPPISVNAGIIDRPLIAPIARRELRFIHSHETADVLAGEFTWSDAAGAQHAADFYVRTCPDLTSAECRARRVNNYNEQFVNQYLALKALGYLRIRYNESRTNLLY